MPFQLVLFDECLCAQMAFVWQLGRLLLVPSSMFGQHADIVESFATNCAAALAIANLAKHKFFDVRFTKMAFKLDGSAELRTAQIALELTLFGRY